MFYFDLQEQLVLQKEKERAEIATEGKLINEGSASEQRALVKFEGWQRHCPQFHSLLVPINSPPRSFIYLF
jgi:hypothetical protein